MLRCLKNEERDSLGFTLVEVLVVASIIGILAAIAIPSLAGSRKSALQAACVKALRSLTDAEEMYYRDNFAYTDNWSELDDYLPRAYSGWGAEGHKHFFIENYSIAMATAYQAQRYTVYAYPTDHTLRLSTFIISDDGIPMYDNWEPVR